MALKSLRNRVQHCELMKFSFVIPAYNYSRFLKRCIQSILSQDCKNCEIIIVDDGSTDDTGNVTADICREYPDRNIIYEYQDNSGPSAARNNGVLISSGEYIWFIDADDILLNDAVKIMSDAAEKFPEAKLLFSGYRSVNEDGRKKLHKPGEIRRDKTTNFRQYVLNGIEGLTTGSVVVKKEVFKSVSFPPDIYTNEDIVFFSHLLAMHPAASIPGIILEKFRHRNSLRKNLKRIKETGLRMVDYLFDKNILNSEQMLLRRIFLAKRCLSIFRSHYLLGDYQAARRYYTSAIHEYPLLILKWPYLRKYLKSFVRR